MEMMIVLTIVAIVAAASAPMVNKKMVRAASDKSPWIFTNGESIGYNIDNDGGIQDRKTATIGANGRAPAGITPRLYINNNSDNNPHILFGYRNNNQMHTNLMQMIVGGSNNKVLISDSNQAGRGTVLIGSGTQSSNEAQVIIGSRASSNMVGAVAIGDNAEVGRNSEQAVAVGQGAAANNSGFQSVAIGNLANTQNPRSIAIGLRSRAIAGNSIAIGAGENANNTTQASGSNAIAIGTIARAVKNDCIAIGRNANANPGVAAVKLRSIAIGLESQATNSDAVAIGTRFAGRRTTASGVGSTALGSTSRATANFAIAIGGSTDTSTNADGEGQVATTQATSEAAVAIGAEAQASGFNSLAIGRSASASTTNSIAIGRGAIANATNSVAIGNGARTPAANTVVLGDSNSIVYIPGRLVVNRTAVLGYASNAWQSWADVAVIRSNRDGRMEILQRDGDGDWDAVFANGRVNWDWASVVTSDRRLKNVGKEFTSGLDKIKKLEVFNYTFKEDKNKTPRVGVIAQDLQKIFPDAVVKGEDGFLRIRMEDMFYAVINAIKELDLRTSAQEKKIQELEKRIEELEKSKK